MPLRDDVKYHYNLVLWPYELDMFFYCWKVNTIEELEKAMGVNVYMNHYIPYKEGT